MSGSPVLAQVIDNGRGRVRLEVITIVAQSARTARVQAIDAEVEVVAGRRMLARAERLDVASKTLRAAENPLHSPQCLQAVPVPIAPGRWAVTVTTRAGGHSAESCSRSCR